MINKEKFGKLFDMLLANPWDYIPDKQRLQRTRDLFYYHLKIYDFNILRTIFEDIITEKDRKKMPTVNCVLGKIAKLNEKINDHKPRLKMPDTRKQRISKFLKDSKKILDGDGSNKLDKLKTISQGFRNG